jgi:hypothetical protein
MGARRMKVCGRNRRLRVGLFLLLILSACFSTRANVYATDIQINGSLQAGVVVPGGPLTISYILNDTATNVSVRIYAGASVAKVFTSEDGGAGAKPGLNTIVWDGTNDNGSAAAEGVYNVSITAAAAGYGAWTNITDDGTNFDVFYPSSITVNRNTNSPYYGRVFIGNASGGGWGPGQGILKGNADGSPADEGGFSAGGYGWGGDGYPNPSPWKMDVGADDRLYVDDWSSHGLVVSFDQVVSSNYLAVLRPDNYPYGKISLSGLCVWGAATNLQLYMADINLASNEVAPGVGIISWMLDTNGVAALGDTGMVAVTLTNGFGLTLAPYAVSVAAHGDIFTIQRVETNNDPDDTVLCFPPVPNGGPPDAMPLWELGAADSTLVENYGVAVDPAGTYVAVASRGYGNDPANFQNGGVSIFWAADGSLAAYLNQDAEGYTNQEFFDVAWDSIGNLYTIYGEDGLSQSGWRVYSPPGSNQATTVAVPFIQVYHSIAPPQLLMPSASMGQLNFTLLGQSNVTYVIQQSTDLVNWTPVATNFSPATVQTISVLPSDTQDFYRAVANP